MASKSSFKKYGLRLLYLVVGLYLLICIGMYAFQDKLVFRPTVLAANAAWDFKLKDEAGLEQSVEEVYFPSALGGNINALHFKSGSGRNSVVMYVHGNGGNMQNYLHRRNPFLQRGYDFFIFDFRGFGKSTGPLSEVGVDADCEAAWDYLQARYPSHNIVLFGQSLGSGFAVRLAAQHPPRQLYLETPYTSLADVGAHDYPWLPVRWLINYPSESQAYVGQVQCPVLVIHGTADKVIPYQQGEAMSKSAVKSQLFTCPGAGHNDCSKTAIYQEMLDKTLH
jgi:uncharacterized protein